MTKAGERQTSNVTSAVRYVLKILEMIMPQEVTSKFTVSGVK